MSTFINKCIDDLSNIKDIDEYIEIWHNEKTISDNIELYDYLGLTYADYCKWSGIKDNLKDIIKKYILDRLKLNKYFSILSNLSFFESANDNLKSNLFYVECEELFENTIFLYNKYDYDEYLNAEYYIVSPFNKEILSDKRDLIDIYESTLEVISFQFSEKTGICNIKIINLLKHKDILDKIKLM